MYDFLYELCSAGCTNAVVIGFRFLALFMLGSIFSILILTFVTRFILMFVDWVREKGQKND